MIEPDWRDSRKYYLSPEQESADAQTTVCMEEFAELIQAISKFKRFNPEGPTNMVGRNELIENLYEEMADVRFTLLIAIYGLKPSELRSMIVAHETEERF